MGERMRTTARKRKKNSRVEMQAHRMGMIIEKRGKKRGDTKRGQLEKSKMQQKSETKTNIQGTNNTPSGTCPEGA